MNLHLKRLNQKGFDHMMVMVVFVALFALVGTYLLIQSHAATTYVQIHLGSYSGPCLSGGSTAGCNSSSNSQVWEKLTGSNFQIKNKAGQCLDDWGGKTHTGPNSKDGFVRAATCYSNDNNQKWSWSGSRLVNASAHGCLNSAGGKIAAGATLLVYACNGASNEIWNETAVGGSTGGGGGGSGGGIGCSGSASQKFICRAQQWGGTPYSYGGGIHGDGEYANWVRGCEKGGIPGTPVKSCGMDCSGFISVVVDDVLGTNYGWIAGNSHMDGSAAGMSHWHRVSESQVVPGDIATASGHVEFVLSVSGGKVTKTYGEHRTGDYVNAKPAGWFTVGAYYHWQ